MHNSVWYRTISICSVCLRFLFTAGLLWVASSCSSGLKNSERAVLHLNLGTSLLNQGNYRAALRELRRAEELDPSNSITQNNLGLNYYFIEEPKLAEKHLRRATILEPKYTDANNNLSRVLIDLGQFDEAEVYAKKVIADLAYQQPEKGWLNLGICYFSKRNFQGAIGPLLKTLKLDPQNCLGFTMLGRTYYELSRYNEAARNLDIGVKYCEALRFDEPLYYAGLAHYKAGNKEKALARLNELTKNYPQGKYSKQASNMKRMML